jgi:hypothetical protein
VVRFNLFRQLLEVWITKPLVPLLCIIAPPYFRLLEKAHHADDAEMLAKYGKPLLTNLFQCHCSLIHSYLTSLQDQQDCVRFQTYAVLALIVKWAVQAIDVKVDA